MSVEQSITEKIEETKNRINDAKARTDSYDSSYSDFLESALEDLRQNGEGKLHAQMAESLPVLKKEEDEEASLRRFDCYDDHYHEKIAMGKTNACRFILGLFE